MVLKLTHPKLRFDSGFEPYINKRKPDTRTVEELKASIKAWANSISEAKRILPELDSMNPKHLGLVADTLELSQKNFMYSSDIDMFKGKSLINPLEALMLQFPAASKKNPHALDFSNEVINNAGLITSKFYLKNSADSSMLVANGVDKNFEKSIPIVDDIVAITVKAPIGGRAPIERQKDFMKVISILLDKDTDVNKIEFLKDIFKTIGHGAFHPFKINRFLQNNATPLQHIKANIETLPIETSSAYSRGKSLDVNAHLKKNPYKNFVETEWGNNKQWD